MVSPFEEKCAKLSSQYSVYFDNNATTRAYTKAAELAHVIATHMANPSSSHVSGKSIKELLDYARSQLASCLGCKNEELVFTSGATESNNLFFHAYIRSVLEVTNEPPVVLLSALEHPAVTRPLSYYAETKQIELVSIASTPDGIVNIKHLELLLQTYKDRLCLVSVMMANNEIGTVQPIPDIVRLAHKYQVPVHTDSTQMLGKQAFPSEWGVKKLSDLKVDYAIGSSHKCHGPIGAGFLYIRKEDVRCKELPCDWITRCSTMRGGKQEFEIRAGTENVPAIFAMAYAMCQNLTPESALRHEEIRSWHNRLESALYETFGSEIQINGGRAPRLFNTTSVSFSFLSGQELTKLLSEHGICVNVGSACSKGPSSVLQALGLSEEHQGGTLRISSSLLTQPWEQETLTNVLIREICRQLNRPLPHLEGVVWSSPLIPSTIFQEEKDVKNMRKAPTNTNNHWSHPSQNNMSQTRIKDIRPTFGNDHPTDPFPTMSLSTMDMGTPSSPLPPFIPIQPMFPTSPPIIAPSYGSPPPWFHASSETRSWIVRPNAHSGYVHQPLSSVPSHWNPGVTPASRTWVIQSDAVLRGSPVPTRTHMKLSSL